MKVHHPIDDLEHNDSASELFFLVKHEEKVNDGTKTMTILIFRTCKKPSG